MGETDDLIARLERLARASRYVTLYPDFGRTLVLKHIGKVIGAVDRPYVEFLMRTNGASVLDHCFLGLKNPALGANLYDHMRELWQVDNMLAVRFWGCVGDSTGDVFGYVAQTNSSGGRFWGHYSLDVPGRVDLVASSFAIFMDKFLSEIERALAADPGALGLTSHGWFLQRDRLVEGDAELARYLQGRESTEYPCHRPRTQRLACWRRVRQPDSRVSDAARSRQSWVPTLRLVGRVDGPGQRQKQAGYRIAAGGLAAIVRWLSPEAPQRRRVEITATKAPAPPPVVEPEGAPAPTVSKPPQRGHPLDHRWLSPEARQRRRCRNLRSVGTRSTTNGTGRDLRA
ncbi:MAG TPA: hypothetical protein PL137_02030, partial [Nocardioides sp.]|nr:hypothetical protein [Nocardioides sp.]